MGLVVQEQQDSCSTARTEKGIFAQQQRTYDEDDEDDWAWPDSDDEGDERCIATLKALHRMDFSAMDEDRRRHDNCNTARAHARAQAQEMTQAQAQEKTQAPAQAQAQQQGLEQGTAVASDGSADKQEEEKQKEADRQQQTAQQLKQGAEKQQRGEESVVFAEGSKCMFAFRKDEEPPDWKQMAAAAAVKFKIKSAAAA